MGRLVDKAWWDGGRGLGGISRERLIRRVAGSKEALLAVLAHLSHPHAGRYANASLADLEEQAWHSAEHWVRALPARAPRPHPLDVVLMAVAQGDVPVDLRHRILGGVPQEADLVGPVTRWLRSEFGFAVVPEVPIGNCRADLVAWKRPFLEREIVAVELKNAPTEVERLPEQLAAYARACDRVCVVMTPACLAAVALHRGEIADPAGFERDIDKIGAWLWVYDATERRFDRLLRGSTDHDRRAYDALWATLTESASRAA